MKCFEMSLITDIEDCCIYLESSKVTDRKKFCNKLSSILDNKDVINILNDGTKASWKQVISSVQECLKKDSDKCIEDAKKKGGDSIINYPSSELFQQIIETAIREADEEVDIPMLVGYIIGCMRDYKMKKCYGTTFLNILQKCILSNPRCRVKLKNDDWTDVYNFLKKNCEIGTQDLVIYRSLMLVIKWGPTSGLLPCVLREEFMFMTQFCRLVSEKSPKQLQEDTLEMALDFCSHTAKDNRVSCCKFGEDMMTNFIDLYEINGREAKIKELLVQFFLFQMVIHQPNGVKEGHPAAYAHNWNTWKKCLKVMFNILSKEIGFYFKYHQKNTSFFKIVGESHTLSEDFSMLFVEVSRQLFMCTDSDISISLDYTFTSQIPQKRQKIDVSLKSYIENIQDTKSWLWIHIVHSIIKSYPDLLEADDYDFLLQLLSSIQIESNDFNVIENIYICFSTLLDMYNLNGGSETDKLWKVIGDSTTRAFALNQHKEATENLLAKLLNNGIIDLHNILQTYTSGILKISIASIKTLESGMQMVDLGKSDESQRENLMNCILNDQNLEEYTYLLHKETAEFLVKLTLKQWPIMTNKQKEKQYIRYSDLKEIYLKTLLEESVFTKRPMEKKAILNCGYAVDPDSATLLLNILEKFVAKNPDTEEILFSKLVLVANICSTFIEYKILNEQDIDNSVLVDLMKTLFSSDNLKVIHLYRGKSERGLKKLLNIVHIIDKLFALDVNGFVKGKIKNLIPFELLRGFIEILNDLQEDQKHKSDLLFELKKAITKALSSFGCVCGSTLNQNQRNILEVLAAPNYSCNLEDDCILLKIFLSAVKLMEPAVLPEEILDNVLKSVQDLCIARYQYSFDAIEILEILKDLYPHFAVSREDDNRVTSVALLKPFYDNRHNYGPNVSIAILECLEELCTLDPHCKFARWSGDEVIRFVPIFLSCDYQEVRYKAIDTLITYFQANSQTKHLQDFHRQEEIFARVYEMSIKVFEVAGEMTEERRIDEVISRTASVLHTFAGIILNCNNWIEECIVSLIKIAFTKKIDSVDKILNIINRKLIGDSNSSVMERFLERIIERWLMEGHKFDDFPFKLYNCMTKSEFYLKYFEVCVPFSIVTDRKDLISAAKELGLNERAIVEKTSAKVFARSICGDIENANERVLERNQILKYYAHVVGTDDLKNILTDNLDQITLGVLEFLTDEKYVRENFDETVIFTRNNLTVFQVEECFRFIESFLCNNKRLLMFLTETNLGKVEKIFLMLKLKTHNAISMEDKLKSLHRYTLFVDMMADILKSNSNWQHYFIKDTVYYSINLMENHKDYSCIMRASCKFLGAFLKKILPTFSDTVGAFLLFTVDSLKLFSLDKNSAVAKQCMEILNFLVIDNACHLMREIEKLDNFPHHSDFERIRIVHEKIKYGEKRVSLEDEINLFLEHKDLSTQQDSLIHLRRLLSQQKSELMKMYDRLRNVRGFSEDCEKSSLHRLVCMLAKLSCSNNEKVSFEAIRCLGELGPANLQTLVLQPERTITDLKCTPYELLLGHVISLLSEYVVDSDINVVRTSSETFYIVLYYKEGRKLAESNLDFGYGPTDKKYIMPYFPISKTSPSANVAVALSLFESRISDDNIWCPKTKVSHETWIVSLVSALLETFTNRSFLQNLLPLCRVKPKFCEKILPLVINLLLSLNITNIDDILSKKIDYFFSEHWNLTVPQYVDLETITLDKKSVKCMLDVVSLIRLQKSFNKSKSRSNSNNGDLKIDYLKVAKAAEFCAAHFSALFYSELWCQAKIEDIQNQDARYCEQRATMIDHIYEHEGPEVGEALQNILRNAYKAIGDLNALPGCGISFLLHPQFRVEHYKDLGKWDQVTQFYAARVLTQSSTTTTSSSAKELMNSFKKCSLYQIPLLCTDQFDEPQYECLWRLSQWTTGEKRRPPRDSLLNGDDFEKYRFFALKSLHDNNKHSFEEALKLQTLCVIDNLKHTSLESSQNLYPVLARLQAIVEIEDFARVSTVEELGLLLEKWGLQDRLIGKNDFQYIEPIVTQRLVMLADRLKIGGDADLLDILADATLDFAGLAKEEGHFKKGLAILENLRCVNDLSEDVKTRIQILDAQLSWLVDNKGVARHILNKLCKNETICPKLRSLALKLSGQYMSETHSENRTTIITDYFLASVKLMAKVHRNESDNKNVMDTYDKLAVFADNEYQQIMAYMKSELFRKKILNMDIAKQTASNIHRQRKRTYDESKAAAIHQKQSNIDEIEINTTRQECNRFLILALKYYLLTLVHSDEKNIRIFRIMSLFLENRNNEQIIETIEDQLGKIPSYKYIPMLPQLIPHITDTSTDLFSKKINEIVEQCAREHPHHTLPLLLSLSNAKKDMEFGDSTKTSKNDVRIATANKLLAKLKKLGMAEHINKLQQLSHALIDLAYLEVPDGNEKTLTIPRNQKILKIQNFDDVLLPTHTLGIELTKNYSRIVGISSFGSVYHRVGGVNHPKRITCIGTDGRTRHQLVKGKDDLRQDAVMQQVFNIMNSVLSTNQQTRNLLIRTYKIVPLSMRSGILEWCDDTMPIGLYLVGEEKQIGAHQIFRPNDKSPTVCRNMFKMCAGKSAEDKLRTYKNVCRNFKPVFHKFFETFFPQPTIWYERRRAYIHSVATSSMCGYILGIGDRHVSNILIDKTTAEVIHIDFGIAFEQGRVLPTPETVPFRLTRDMVDGMGVSGVEGIFRRSCENTMEVLRQNAQTITTILEVLLYDPLYVWTVTSAEANKRQTDEDCDLRNLTNESSSDEDNVTVNITAERALLRLREKLQGTELGHPTSIEHQVGTLIQQAIDPANLCKLFVGWQPYL